jgi:glycolate oxidase subunit GlcD
VGSVGPQSEMRAELRRVLSSDASVLEVSESYEHDATEHQSFSGRPDAVVAPASPEEVAALVRWCYEHDVPVVPRGGGTGFAGGAVPVDGGVVVSSERLRRVRKFEPQRWRAQVEAGLRTHELHRLARENGVYFPPDPGASEQSHIGGNIACNAGGPHAFKYGVTGAWVTGLEAVVPPGEVVTLGRGLTKDVAGLDLKSLLIGSEGTLGFITAAWLRLIPAPECQLPVMALYEDIATGCEAIDSVLGSGIRAAALEYLDERTVEVAGAAYPPLRGAGRGFAVIAEADGTEHEAARIREELLEVLGPGARWTQTPTGRQQIRELWRWRDGVSIAVAAKLGGKVSEDVAVPLEALPQLIEATVSIGGAHGLDACSWGHAGDGNLHATFMLDQADPEALARSQAACDELFGLAISVGGTISGEHGVGFVKRPYLERQVGPVAFERMQAVKRVFDPKGLMNPGKGL